MKKFANQLVAAIVLGLGAKCVTPHLTLQNRGYAYIAP